MLAPMIAVALIAGAQPEVTMYGASWCGPCGAVKSWLDQNKVAFRYLDIDDEKNLAAFHSEGGTAIPMMIVGREKIVGANFEQIAKSLSLGAQARPSSGSGESYGGYSPSWWQAQFRGLRTRSADLALKIDTQSRSASYDDEKKLIELMKQQRKIIDASIDALEADASRVSLPRKYRE